MNTTLPTRTPLRLTFGCSNLGSDLGLDASRALVEGALDCGYRQFDVAPSYGNGLAESILGDVVRSVRDEVTIITKTGIAHPKAASGFRALRKVVLPIKKAFPGLWKAAAGQAQRSVVTRGNFSREAILASVAESTRRLRVESVDALLLHEVLPQDITDELFATLDELRARGCMKTIGLGTTVESSIPIVARHPGRFELIQVNHHWGAFVPELQAGPHRLNTHRWLKTGTRIVSSEAFRSTLEPELKAILDDPEQAPLLLLAAAQARNPRGQLLVSSSKLSRLEAFAKASTAGLYDALAPKLNAHLARIATPTQAED
jgi:hypothetical protein